jgi:hypothetical protein
MAAKIMAATERARSGWVTDGLLLSGLNQVKEMKGSNAAFKEALAACRDSMKN